MNTISKSFLDSTSYHLANWGVSISALPTSASYFLDHSESKFSLGVSGDLWTRYKVTSSHTYKGAALMVSNSSLEFTLGLALRDPSQLTSLLVGPDGSSWSSWYFLTPGPDLASLLAQSLDRFILRSSSSNSTQCLTLWSMVEFVSLISGFLA